MDGLRISQDADYVTDANEATTTSLRQLGYAIERKQLENALIEQMQLCLQRKET